MKISFVLSFAALICEVVCSRQPGLQWDPDTASDCVEWYDNGGDETCEYVRDYFTITPQQFHEWNPSLGLDCKPWSYQSYCIVTQRRLDDSNKLSSTTTPKPSTTTPTSTTSSLAPSPTAWYWLGCYAQNPNRSILERNMSPNGDSALTLSKCKDACYHAGYMFAGAQEGNECWCSNYVAGESAKNPDQCYMSCTGDASEVCGGKGVVSVWEALENNEVVVSSTSTSSQAAVTSTITSIEAAATSNGAAKNRALFGMRF